MNLRRTIANPVTLAGLLVLLASVRACRYAPALASAQTIHQAAQPADAPQGKIEGKAKESFQTPHFGLQGTTALSVCKPTFDENTQQSDL